MIDISEGLKLSSKILVFLLNLAVAAIWFVALYRRRDDDTLELRLTDYVNGFGLRSDIRHGLAVVLALILYLYALDFTIAIVEVVTFSWVGMIIYDLPLKVNIVAIVSSLTVISGIVYYFAHDNPVLRARIAELRALAVRKLENFT
jgi:hypothetical protein